MAKFKKYLTNHLLGNTRNFCTIYVKNILSKIISILNDIFFGHSILKISINENYIYITSFTKQYINITINFIMSDIKNILNEIIVCSHFSIHENIINAIIDKNEKLNWTCDWICTDIGNYNFHKLLKYINCISLELYIYSHIQHIIDYCNYIFPYINNVSLIGFMGILDEYKKIAKIHNVTIYGKINKKNINNIEYLKVFNFGKKKYNNIIEHLNKNNIVKFLQININNQNINEDWILNIVSQMPKLQELALINNNIELFCIKNSKLLLSNLQNLRHLHLYNIKIDITYISEYCKNLSNLILHEFENDDNYEELIFKCKKIINLEFDDDNNELIDNRIADRIFQNIENIQNW